MNSALEEKGHGTLFNTHYINLDKTEITVSANVSGEMKTKLKDILGVQAVEQHQKYLGLPTLIGKRKKEVFAGIVDRILQKMKDWKEQTLSQAGREVLIKTVLQAIPTYSMNCFLFPITTCQEIERATTRFFWGSTLEDRKTHWAAWDILTTTKANGGMGFRELHFFNIAMLAKQFWNILQHPNSITHRILKAKYFPRHDIIAAGLGYQPSYLWRSLLAAKGVVEEGMAWRVGNGRSINMAMDRWIGVDNQSKPEQLTNGDWRGEGVDKLIDENERRWKHDLVHQLFTPDDARRITSIPISSTSREDRRVWRFTKHGGFTVKSAYHHAVQLLSRIHNDRPTSSSLPKEWKKIWKIVAIPRVRIFIWKACSNALPTKENLIRRGGDLDPICAVCGDEIETLDHILLHCQDARRIWYSSTLRMDTAERPRLTFRDMLWTAMTHYPKEYVSLVAYNAWEIWKARNRLCFEGQRTDINHTTRKAYSQCMEIIGMQPEICSEPSHTTPIVKWKTPHAGKLKLNCDVAIGINGKVGYGFALRNELGRIVIAGKTEQEAMGSSTLLEGMAMRWALQVIRQYGKKTDSVESDSRQLIDGINGRSTPETYCAVIIEDIRSLAQEFHCTTFHWIPRVSNQVAHEAAKGPPFISIDHTPRHLLQFLEGDVTD